MSIGAWHSAVVFFASPAPILPNMEGGVPERLHDGRCPWHSKKRSYCAGANLELYCSKKIGTGRMLPITVRETAKAKLLAVSQRIQANAY